MAVSHHGHTAFDTMASPQLPRRLWIGGQGCIPCCCLRVRLSRRVVDTATQETEYEHSPANSRIAAAGRPQGGARVAEPNIDHMPLRCFETCLFRCSTLQPSRARLSRGFAMKFRQLPEHQSPKKEAVSRTSPACICCESRFAHVFVTVPPPPPQRYLDVNCVLHEALTALGGSAAEVDWFCGLWLAGAIS